MNLPASIRAQIATQLDAFPEVAWDRCAGDADYGVAYGWIGRDDGRSDFLVLNWWKVLTADDVAETVSFGFTTSSARYSAEFAKRLGCSDDEHAECERIEVEFPTVALAIRLGEFELVGGAELGESFDA